MVRAAPPIPRPSRTASWAPILAVALALALGWARAAPAAERIAVLPAPAGAPAASAVASAVVEAVRQAGAEPVPAEEVSRALAAAKQEPATCGSTPACAAAASAAVGARALLVASVTESGRFWMVEVRLREAKGGWLKGQAVSAVDRNEQAAREAVAKLVARVLPPFLSGAPPAAVTAAPAPAPASSRPLAASIPLPPPPVLAPPRPRGVEGPAAPPRAAPTTPSQDRPPTPAPAPATETAGQRLAARLATPAPRDPEAAPSGPGGWSAVLMGGGAALIAGGAAAGLLAWSEGNDADLALARGDVGIYAVKRRSSQTLALTAAGVGGAGAAAVAAGMWLRLGARSNPVALGVEPGRVRVSVAF